MSRIFHACSRPHPRSVSPSFPSSMTRPTYRSFVKVKTVFKTDKGLIQPTEQQMEQSYKATAVTLQSILQSSHETPSPPSPQRLTVNANANAGTSVGVGVRGQQPSRQYPLHTTAPTSIPTLHTSTNTMSSTRSFRSSSLTTSWMQSSLSPSTSSSHHLSSCSSLPSTSKPSSMVRPDDVQSRNYTYIRPIALDMVRGDYQDNASGSLASGEDEHQQLHSTDWMAELDDVSGVSSQFATDQQHEPAVRGGEDGRTIYHVGDNEVI